MKLPPGISVFCRAIAWPHLVDGQAVGVEPVRIEQDPDLAPAIAHQLHFADVLHRLEHLLDLLVGDLA